MNKKQMACVVVLVLVLAMVQGTLWMKKRMDNMRREAAKAEQKVKNSSTQLALEKKQLDDLRKNSSELINYLNLWQPYFAAIDSPQNAELKISLKIKEDELISLSQRYDVVTQKNVTLPRLMRAQVTFEDNYARLFNWIGRMEAELPTMRISGIRMGPGTNPDDLKVSLTMEQPILTAK